MIDLRSRIDKQRVQVEAAKLGVSAAQRADTEKMATALGREAEPRGLPLTEHDPYATQLASPL